MGATKSSPCVPETGTYFNANLLVLMLVLVLVLVSAAANGLVRVGTRRT